MYPVTAKKSVAAAQRAGLSAATLPALLVEGDNRPGLCHAISKPSRMQGSTGISLWPRFGRKYSAVFGFDSEEDATKGAALIRKAAAAKRK